jgi:hypothetical protein
MQPRKNTAAVSLNKRRIWLKAGTGIREAADARFFLWRSFDRENNSWNSDLFKGIA